MLRVGRRARLLRAAVHHRGHFQPRLVARLAVASFWANFIVGTIDVQLGDSKLLHWFDGFAAIHAFEMDGQGGVMFRRVGWRVAL
jgi:hypothetical protein